MQKRPVRMRALALEIGQKVPAQLAPGHKTSHQRTGIMLPRPQRSAARHKTADIAHLPAIDGERMFRAEKHRIGRHRRTFHRTRGMGTGEIHFQQQNSAERHLLFAGRERIFLPHIARAVAQDGMPGQRQIAIRTFKIRH